MRSLFSNRYDNKREEFYERYEAARALHPSLPLYERPVEPARLQTVDNSVRRRYKSYRELNHQTSEKFHSQDWLASDRLPIVVRRRLEERNHQVLMPKYNPLEAHHEFSHIGRFKQRGRPPAAATVAKIVSDFAQQVGGVPYVDTAQDCSDPDTDNSDAVNIGEEPTETEMPHNLVEFQPLQPAKAKARAKPKLKRGRKTEPGQNLAMEEKENTPAKQRCELPRTFICPEPCCQQNFDMRRCLSKHQRETGHHSWSHKCDKCGQIFRTAGFKRMHALGACVRNLHKQISKLQSGQ